MESIIRPAALPADLPMVQDLMREYVQSLEIDLRFQDVDAELATLPGKYAAPAGRLLLAWHDGEAVGCIALRPIDAERCEMKRLYVRPGMRGHQFGRRLVEHICVEARAAGYTRICLDALPWFDAAIRLYTSLGFTPTDPYVFNPVPGTLFLERDL
jgi:GNAT superfamily N-acetyltransferase